MCAAVSVFTLDMTEYVALAAARYMWAYPACVSAGEFVMATPGSLGGDWCGQEADERRARWLTARCPGIPFAETEEVAAGRGEDVAEVDFRLAPLARASQAATADPAGERARDPGAARVGLVARGGRLAPPGGPERLELGARAQAARPAG